MLRLLRVENVEGPTYLKKLPFIRAALNNLNPQQPQHSIKLLQKIMQHIGGYFMAAIKRLLSKIDPVFLLQLV